MTSLQDSFLTPNQKVNQNLSLNPLLCPKKGVCRTLNSRGSFRVGSFQNKSLRKRDTLSIRLKRASRVNLVLKGAIKMSISLSKSHLISLKRVNPEKVRKKLSQHSLLLKSQILSQQFFISKNQRKPRKSHLKYIRYRFFRKWQQKSRVYGEVIRSESSSRRS